MRKNVMDTNVPFRQVYTPTMQQPLTWAPFFKHNTCTYCVLIRIPK